MKTAKDIFDETGPCAIIDVTHGVAVIMLTSGRDQPEWGKIVPLAEHNTIDTIIGMWWRGDAPSSVSDPKAFSFEPTAGSHCVRLLPMREFAQYGFGVLWNDAIKEAAARSVAFKFEDAVRV